MKSASRLLRQLVEGVAHFHGLGIVHGDLSIANMLIRRDGGSGFEPSAEVLRISDFGGAGWIPLSYDINEAVPKFMASQSYNPDDKIVVLQIKLSSAEMVVMFRDNMLKSICRKDGTQSWGIWGDFELANRSIEWHQCITVM